MKRLLKQESFFKDVDANDKRSQREYLAEGPWRSRKRKAVSMFLEFSETEYEVLP